MTFEFYIELEGTENPVVWRSIAVPASISFDSFHEIIQEAFGWENAHLYEFSRKWEKNAVSITDPDFQLEEPVKSSHRYKLKSYFKKPGDRIIYTYDFGDNWNHVIELKAVGDEQLRERAICLDGQGKCPPEDVGSLRGFAIFKAGVNNPDHEEYMDFREWLSLQPGEYWNPDEFNKEKINLALAQ